MAPVSSVSLSLWLALGFPFLSTSDEIPPLWPDAAEIEQFLKEAKVIERKKLGQGITNPDKVTLESGRVTRHAIFKKVDESYDSWRFEVAAYELSKLLGLGMVPPTVERGIGGRKGCLQLWVEGVTLANFNSTPPDPENWRRQVSLMWFFDDLIANIDRHMNNAIVTPDFRLALIDNSKTFRSQRELINDLNRGATGTHARYWLVPYDKDRREYPTTYPEDFIERFRRVPGEQIKKTVSRYVWGYDKDLILKRRQMILERLAAIERKPQEARP